ncbi:hypothetical protein VTN49DRAFT_2083 [Thermomyces lanuginosus]|uniref:uncharacterized protein n=1 Tax=Thermomyces lanuginosus TaxID=5541 RepID=UPI003742679F
MPAARSQPRQSHGLPTTRRSAGHDDDDHPRGHPRGGDSDEEGYSTEEEEEVEEGEEDDDNEEEETSDPLASMVRAQSRIVYDVDGLEMEARFRAVAGLTSEFGVVYCRDVGGGFEFQLEERPVIHIGGGSARCSCSEFETRPDMACRHIFWLADQLYDSLTPQTPPPGLPLTKEGFSPNLPHVEDLLRNGLEELAERLEWPYLSEPNRPRSRGMSREDKVRDIISAFKDTLPEEFRPDLVERSNQPRTPEQCVVQGDLEATLFRLAVHDDNVYRSLRKAMPAGACAAIYFDKIRKRCRRILAQFDEYCRTGTLPPGVPSMEARQVAEALRRCVKQIEVNLDMRNSHGTEDAAETLVSLLLDIAARNIDAFAGSHWRAPQPGEDEDDNNLYEQLIGQANETDGFFILDALDKVPPSVLSEYVPSLVDALSKIEVNRAPAPYIIKLKNLINDVQTGQRAKRPATAEAGGSQKRTR